MRTNLPVTNVEYPITDETLIVSKTDLKGKLTYFNDQFVDASGFTEQELMGQPHNIIRHPDMPPEAFGNLWDTLKAGKPWAGAVKNRRKNGDFYWVLASATPIWETARSPDTCRSATRLPADQREEAEHVYALFRANKAQAYTLTAGVVRRRTLATVCAVHRHAESTPDHAGGGSGCFHAVVGVAGILATRDSNKQLKSIYEDRTVPLAQLFDINDRMKGNTIALYDALAKSRAGKPPGDVAGIVSGNIEAISKTWTEYMATYLTPEEKIVADDFATKRKNYVEKAIKPALALLADHKYDELDALLAGTANQLFALAKEDLDKLVAIQVKEAKALYEGAERQYVVVLGFSIAILAIGLLLGGWIGIQTIRAIGRPLEQLNGVMGKIAQGLFNSRVAVERDDEIGIALRNVQAMQAKLGFDRESQKDMEKRVAIQRKADMHKLAGDFEAAVGEIIETVASAATELEAAAGTLTTSANPPSSFRSRLLRLPRKRPPTCSRWPPPPKKWRLPSTRSAVRCRNRQGWPSRPSTRPARPTIASANCRRQPPASAT